MSRAVSSESSQLKNEDIRCNGSKISKIKNYFLSIGSGTSGVVLLNPENLSGQGRHELAGRKFPSE